MIEIRESGADSPAEIEFPTLMVGMGFSDVVAFKNERCGVVLKTSGNSGREVLDLVEVNFGALEACWEPYKGEICIRNKEI